MKQRIARYFNGSQARQTDTFSNENTFKSEETTMTAKFIKALALTISLGTYGCSAAQYEQNIATIMDRGLGIPSQVYTVIPEGYQISGYKTTDP